MKENTRIVELEKTVEELQQQIDCITQMLGYTRTENDFIFTGYEYEEGNNEG